MDARRNGIRAAAARAAGSRSPASGGGGSARRVEAAGHGTPAVGSSTWPSDDYRDSECRASGRAIDRTGRGRKYRATMCHNSTKMKSIARRIAKLEVTLSSGPEPEDWRGRRWMSRMAPPPPRQVRFGNLRRLPEDYKGERHTEIAKCLPDRNGQKWREFTEMPGPALSLLPQDPRLPGCLDVVFVAPYPARS